MIKVNKLPQSVVEFEGELDAENFEKHRGQALKELAEDLEIPGFRKGNAPAEIVEKSLPAGKILERMAILAIAEIYPELIREHKIEAIGKPEITITKLAPKNPLGFKIKTAILPTWQLPDYRGIAEKEPVLDEIIVTDEEFKNTIETIRQMRKNEAGELPIYDDEFVKGIGKFTDIADFEKKLRENIKLEKETKEKDKRRLKIIRAILEATPIDLPQIIVDYELENLVHQFKHDVERSGLKLDDYLANAKTDLATLRKSWGPAAVERAKAELVLSRISEEENLRPTEAELEENMKYHGSGKNEKEAANIRNYIYGSLIREKVLQFLEGLAKQK
jgi:FKBP-type peptidyl-prolyl cis-trans isomerase (trigger factor)